MLVVRWRMTIVSHITREAFTVPRTPGDLARYIHETYDYIAANSELKKVARLRKEPYKTFLEELIPFGHFCTWKYGNRDDVMCALVPGTPGRDATVTDIRTGSEHSVEITWPIDGRAVIRQNELVNERGCSDVNTFDWDDPSQYKAAIDRTLIIAKKKAVRDYREPGGSTIMFVFDHSLFWDSNPKHVDLLKSLKDELSAIPLLAGNVMLMLIFGDQQRIIEVKSNEQYAVRDHQDSPGSL